MVPVGCHFTKTILNITMFINCHKIVCLEPLISMITSNNVEHIQSHSSGASLLSWCQLPLLKRLCISHPSIIFLQFSFVWVLFLFILRFEDHQYITTTRCLKYFKKFLLSHCSLLRNPRLATYKKEDNTIS